MRTADIFDYGLFLFVTFGTFFICVENNLESQYDILYFTTGFYFALRLVKSIVNIADGRRIQSVLNFLISIGLLHISLKVYYYYYNTFLAYSILLVSVIAIIVLTPDVQENSLKRTRNYLIFIVVITAITISIPDKVFMFYTSPSATQWKPNIQYADFKGRTYDPSDSMTASINSGLRWKVNRAFDYPPAIVVSQMSPDNSQLNASKGVTEGDSHIFAHEQVHFNIKEFYARLTMDSLRSHWLIDKKDVDRVVYHFARKANTQDSLYDQETLHGIDDLLQAKWTEDYLHKLELK